MRLDESLLLAKVCVGVMLELSLQFLIPQCLLEELLGLFMVRRMMCRLLVRGVLRATVQFVIVKAMLVIMGGELLLLLLLLLSFYHSFLWKHN